MFMIFTQVALTQEITIKTFGQTLAIKLETFCFFAGTNIRNFKG